MLEIKRVLCPTDFSEASQFVLKFAGDLCVRYGAEMHVIHVVQPLPIYSLDPGVGLPLPADFHTDISEEARRALASQECAATVPVIRRVVEGEPATEIIAYAQAHHCDLIILGTHGRGRLAHMLMGSVAEHVFRKAPCPVMTIRPAAKSNEHHRTGSLNLEPSVG